MRITGNITAHSTLLLVAASLGHKPQHMHLRLKPGAKCEPEWVNGAMVIACCGLVEAPIVGHVAVHDNAHIIHVMSAN